MSDKRRDVRAGNAPPILRADPDRRRIGHDKLPAIARNVRIDAERYRIEDRRFAVIPASHNERDALPDQHAADLPAVRQAERRRE